MIDLCFYFKRIQFMKKVILLFFLGITLFGYGQKEGQNFCKGIIDGSYFPLDIQKKKIFWYNTYYFEEKLGTKDLNGKTYLEYKQTWKNGKTDLMYLREVNSTIVEFEEGLTQETTRYSPQFEEGYSWNKADQLAVYTILSYKGTLKTPYCNYDNLLVIEAKYKTVTFEFYYLKGLGYVGATENNKLISFITPEM